MREQLLEKLEQDLLRGGRSKREVRKLIHKASAMGPGDGARFLAGKGASYQTAFHVLSQVRVTNWIGALLVWGIAISFVVFSIVNIAYTSRLIPDFEPGPRLVRLGLTALCALLLVLRVGFARWLMAIGSGLGAVIGFFAVMRAMSAEVDLGDYGTFAGIMIVAYGLFTWLLVMNERVELYFCRK